ncbi:hypothetical protein DM01DRAFT_1340468 [Hesseltinella vesiculosa]|uniref:Uncharacterized protein n=1 Tax=Hesseltinella vesiculosa TaxID=101127 RepID=A0A1X2G473_9FUNG|nr:hypothetical protein DM01DRAFT_1340468 [Hesseltinella vesiculosa]
MNSDISLVSPDNLKLELACNRSLLAFSIATFLVANASAVYFKNFMPQAYLITAAFSYMAYYILCEVQYTIIHDAGVYELIYYIISVVEYLGRLAVWLCAIEVFRSRPRVPTVWILNHLLYLLALGLFGVFGVCYAILGIVKMVMNATTPPSIVNCIPAAYQISIYMFFGFVGGVFLLFLAYWRKVNTFYYTFVFYYMLLVPGVLVLTINYNLLSKTNDHDVYVAYVSEYVCYRLFYLFAIFWGSLFSSQWVKRKDGPQPHDVTANDVVDIDIDDIGEFDEKAENGSTRQYHV